MKTAKQHIKKVLPQKTKPPVQEPGCKPLNMI